MQLRIAIPSLELVDWLEKQPLFPKFYWEDPKKEKKIAAIGSTYAVENVPLFAKDDRIEPRFFGGRKFDCREKEKWKGFPSSYFFLPHIEIEQSREGTLLTVNRTLSTIPKDWLESIDFSNKRSCFPDTLPKREGRIDTPSLSTWKEQVSEGLTKIAEGKMEKIVFARATKLFFKERVSTYTLLRYLQTREKGEVLFAFTPGENKSESPSFLGLTPETFYIRHKRKIETVALAGTIPKKENALFLLQDPKSLEEFQIVERWISAKLALLCQEVHSSPLPTVVETHHLYHLLRSFTGNLKQRISDQDLFSCLHPTPALGGLPQKEAVDALFAIELFDRGWYGAPIGWVSKEDAHFVVAIRSALIETETLTSFAGVGIVRGSDPGAEWEELETKIVHYLWDTQEDNGKRPQ